MQAEMEVTKVKEQAKGQINKAVTKTQSDEQIKQKEMSNYGQLSQMRMNDMMGNFQKDLDRNKDNE